MKKTLLTISTLLLATLACNTTLPQAEPTSTPAIRAISTLPQTEIEQGQANLPLTEADVPRVAVEEAKLALDNGEAILVDVRGVNFYAEGHIIGAISIPLDQFENNVENIPLKKDQWIITYCT